MIFLSVRLILTQGKVVFIKRKCFNVHFLKNSCTFNSNNLILIKYNKYKIINWMQFS